MHPPPAAAPPGDADWAGDPLAGHPRWESVRALGVGQRSRAVLARDRVTGELAAVKLIPRGWDESATKYIMREVLIHQELSRGRHPHIVEFKEVLLTQRHLGVVMEWVEGEDLQTFLTNTGGRVAEPLARFLFQQLVLALDYCHRKGKVSRDIKLANTLLSLEPGQLPLLKLCDFAFAKDTARHSMPVSQVGTALFAAPEVLLASRARAYDGAAADVWSTGIVLCILLLGRHPYLTQEDLSLAPAQQMLAFFRRAAAGELCLAPSERAALSPECADLLPRLLCADPSKRATLAEVCAHPWFRAALPEGAESMNEMVLAEEARGGVCPQDPALVAAVLEAAQKKDPSVPTHPYAPGAGSGGVQPSLGSVGPGEHLPRAFLYQESSTQPPGQQAGGSVAEEVERQLHQLQQAQLVLRQQQYRHQESSGSSHPASGSSFLVGGPGSFAVGGSFAPGGPPVASDPSVQMGSILEDVPPPSGELLALLLDTPPPPSAAPPHPSPATDAAAAAAAGAGALAGRLDGLALSAPPPPPAAAPEPLLTLDRLTTLDLEAFALPPGAEGGGSPAATSPLPTLFESGSLAELLLRCAGSGGSGGLAGFGGAAGQGGGGGGGAAASAPAALGGGGGGGGGGGAASAERPPQLQVDEVDATLDDYRAFMVDEEEEEEGGEGGALQVGRLTSASMDLRGLSELLASPSQAQLMQGSRWHRSAGTCQ